MTVNLMQFSGDNRELHKTHKLTTVSSGVTCNVTMPLDIIKPNFILDYPKTDFNYLYSPDLERYYFVSDLVMLPGGKISVVCKVDVLMSAESEIGSATATIIRTGSGATDICDNKLPLLAKTTIHNEFLDCGFRFNEDNYHYALTVVD